MTEEIKRICNFYNKFKKKYDHNSMWTETLTKPCHKIFNIFSNNRYEKCRYLLENIGKYPGVTEGYDPCGSTKNFYSYLTKSTEETILKMLKEMNIEPVYLDNNELNMENIFTILDDKLGFRVEFPEYFDYENRYDILTSRGKISHRNIFALYYVYNISKHVEDVKNTSVLEIGPGSGRTAYWAHNFGFKKYTIIDIVNSNIIQAHYNFCSLGSKNVCLSGEEDTGQFLKIINNTEYSTLNEKFDIIANFDGLTEYGIETAQKYFDRFHLLSNKFISINHKYNSYSVSDLYKSKENIKIKIKEECNYRSDHKLLGYVKEVILF